MVRITLPVSTDDTAELIHYVLQGLEKIYRPEYLYKKVGVMLVNLMPLTLVQPHLFDHRNRDCYRLLMDTIDQINHKFGRGTIQFAAAGVTKPWQMRSSKPSPRYTTQWAELPIVKAR